MLEGFDLIPITRKSSTSRALADVSIGYNNKGHMLMIFSPKFIKANPSFTPTAKVTIGFNATSNELLIKPVEDSSSLAGVRTLRKRHGFEGASCLSLSPHILPEAFPKVVKRTPLDTWRNLEGCTVFMLPPSEA